MDDAHRPALTQLLGQARYTHLVFSRIPFNRRLALALSLVGAFWVAACAPLSPVPDQIGEQPPPTLPAMEWPAGDVYAIDAARSEFRVELTAEGPLARFGHPHVIGTQQISGQVVVADPWPQTAFELGFLVDNLRVDPPAWRAQAGLEPNIPQSDIDATEINMRSPTQLNAEIHPEVVLQSRSITGTRHEPTVEVDVAIAGHISRQTLPVKVHWGEDELIVSGQTTWQLSALGIEPFSVFGGGLRVGDEITLSVRLYAVAGSDQSMGD